MKERKDLSKKKTKEIYTTETKTNPPILFTAITILPPST